MIARLPIVICQPREGNRESSGKTASGWANYNLLEPFFLAGLELRGRSVPFEVAIKLSPMKCFGQRRTQTMALGDGRGTVPLSEWLSENRAWAPEHGGEIPSYEVNCPLQFAWHKRLWSLFEEDSIKSLTIAEEGSNLRFSLTRSRTVGSRRRILTRWPQDR